MASLAWLPVLVQESRDETETVAEVSYEYLNSPGEEPQRIVFTYFLPDGVIFLIKRSKIKHTFSDI